MTSEKRSRFARRAATALGLFVIVACGAAEAAGQGAAAPPAATQAVERLALPGKDWALDLSLPGFVKVVDSFHAEGSERLLMAGPASRKRMLMLMVRMMPARLEGGGKEFREHALATAKKNGAEISDSDTFEYGGLPLLRYRFSFSFLQGVPPTLPGWGAPLTPKHRSLSAFLARDGVWVQITLVGEAVGEKEEEALYAVLDTVKFVDTSAPATSFDFFHKGRPFYEAGQYAKAVGFYRRALELERRERRLDAALWRQLVEESARAYGAAGDLNEARAIAEHGLSKEPDYARFHLLMAIIHASRDDLDSTIAALQKAFQHKATLPPGQRLPDPRTHPPFRHFSQDEKFRQATKNMKP
jgi:tetratricopeptide (TPR) repeat protein